MGATWSCPKCDKDNMGSYCDCTSDEVRELEARIKEMEEYIAHPPSRPLCLDCQHLKVRIKELEDRLELTANSYQNGEFAGKVKLDIGACDGIAARDATIELLDERIEQLESGSCRFNCRTAKSAFLAGFDAGADDAFEGGKIIDDDFYKEVTEAAYKEWNVK